MKHEPHHLPVEHESPDQWHRHSAEEGTPQAEHGAIASPGALAAAFVAISVTVAITVLIIQVFFDQYNANYRAQQVETTALSTNFNKYKSQWEQQDSKGYGLADAQSGAVRIPLEMARQRVVDRYASSGGGAAKK